MDKRPSRFGKLLLILSFLLAGALPGMAQTSQSSTTPPADAGKAAPPQTQTPPPQKSLVDDAQDQIKKLHDYMHPPEPARDLGDPNVKVWADLRTALYYCPGSKQYGHTSKGKYLTQKEAEDSNFQSALRVPCPTQPMVETKKPTKKTSKTASSKKSAPGTATGGKQEN